jgi:hypothetical protein
MVEVQKPSDSECCVPQTALTALQNILMIGWLNEFRAIRHEVAN